MLKPVSCDHVTSFSYDDKKARDVGLTCWCYLSNNMPGSIFHESMRQGITSFFFVFFLNFFGAGWYFLFSSGWKRWNQFYHYNSERGEVLSYNGLRQMGWDWLAFSEIWSLKHVRRFQTKNFIVGFLCLCTCVLFLTRDGAFLFNTICLRVVANGF